MGQLDLLLVLNDDASVERDLSTRAIEAGHADEWFRYALFLEGEFPTGP